MVAIFEYPDELEFWKFFESGPVESATKDGYWCYEVTDRRHITLRFSFNTFERSVQTTILIRGEKLSTVSHEGAVFITIDRGKLNCKFEFLNSKTLLEVVLEPEILISWGVLETK